MSPISKLTPQQAMYHFLAGAEMRFLAPVGVGETLVATGEAERNNFV